MGLALAWMGKGSTSRLLGAGLGQGVALDGVTRTFSAETGGAVFASGGELKAVLGQGPALWCVMVSASSVLAGCCAKIAAQDFAALAYSA